MLPCHGTPAGPWCSGQTCQPVTLEIAGSNPVGPATAHHHDQDVPCLASLTVMASDTLDERIHLLGLRLRRLSLGELRRLGDAARVQSTDKHRAFRPDAAFGLAD